MDERLRNLERAARAEPSDRAKAWTFVHALDQANDQQRAWQERCLLARAGDERAWLELDGPVVNGVREIGRVGVRDLDESLRLIGANSRSILVAGPDGLYGLDANTLETLWSHPEHADWLLSGSRVFGGGTELVVLDATTGAALHRGPLPDAGAGVWWPRAQSADRLLLVCQLEDGPSLVVDTGLHLGDVVAHLPNARAGMSTHAAHGLGLRHLNRWSTLEAFDLETGSLRWRWDGALLDADARGALVRGRRLRGVGPRLLDVRTGAVLVEAATEARMGRLTQDLLILLNDGLHFALERTTGQVRWTVPRPSDPIWLECAHDVLYMANGTGRPETRDGTTFVRAMDLADGATRWEYPVVRRPRSVKLVAIDRAVVALVGDRLVRISAP